MARKIKFVQSCGVLSKVIFDNVEQFYCLGSKIGLLFSSVEARDSMDRFLWTSKPLSFIPHATDKDTDLDLQPVYLSTCLEFPNFPDVLLCVDCVPASIVCEEEIIIFPSDSKFLETIRSYYKSLQNSSSQVSFVKE